MIDIGSLWLAILLASALVWIASAIIWMALPWHKTDMSTLPDEDGARQALGSLKPGQYDIPHCTDMKAMQQPETKRKFDEGPVAVVTILENGPPPIGRNLVLTVAFYLVVSTIVAYVASRSLAPGADYLTVFRFTGTVAWLAYGFAVIPDAIWFGRPWSNTFKVLMDALIYALLTAGVFGWLWPG